MNKLLLYLLVFFSNFTLFGQSVLEIKDGFTDQVLSQEIQYFVDDSGTLNTEQARQQEFFSKNIQRPNFGFIDGALWLKIQIENNSNQQNFVFQLNQPNLDSIRIELYDDSQTLLQTSLIGESLAISSREVRDRFFMIPFEMEKGAKRELMVRIVSVDPIEVPLYICTTEGSNEIMRISDFLMGGYFGLILVMALYNLFIYFSVKDKSYLLYVFYILFVGLTQGAVEGYTHLYLWPENGWLASRSIYVFTSMVSISSVLFLQNFLQTKIYAPKMHRLSYYLMGGFGLLIIASLFTICKTIHISAQIGIGLVSFYIFATSVVVYRKGYSPAKYFLLAWSVLLVGIFAFALKDAGVIPSNPVTSYLLLVGSAIEVVLLSLALADRINILKREKAISQALALEAAQENEKIVREQNIVLEEKVKIRTFDLENSNSQLTTTLSELKQAQSKLVDAEKMASLGQLTAGIAHEINNPINFVSANINPLRLDVQDLMQIINLYDGIADQAAFDSQKDKVESFKKEIDLDYVKQEIDQLLDGIQDGAQRTAEIVKGLKNFSRIDESNLKPIDINQGIESTLVILKSEIPDGTKIIKDFGDLPLVECLGGKINQVFMNIITNGLQSIAMKGPDEVKELKIKTWQEGGHVLIRITDSGIGMDEDGINHIFEPFYTTKDVGEGTGLGLSISFNIIETHMGKILVDSTLGSGATFTIQLPVESQIEERLD